MAVQEKSREDILNLFEGKAEALFRWYFQGTPGDDEMLF
jgi:hypothetical protein